MNIEIITQLIYVHLWQGVLLVPIIWIISSYFIKKDSALRHGLWFSTLCMLVILPCTTFIDLPRLTTQWFQMDAAVEIVDDITSSNISDFFIVNVEQNDAATPQILSTETSTNLTLFAALFVWVAGICLNIASITQELIYSIKFTNKIKLKPIANEFLPIKWPLENSAFRTPRPMDVTYSTNTFICNMVVSICTYSIKTNIDRT